MTVYMYDTNNQTVSTDWSCRCTFKL